MMSEGGNLQASIQRKFGGGFRLNVAFKTETPPGSVLVVFGPSGSGKTTLLRCLAGLESVDQGSIEFDETIWCDTERRLLVRPQQRHIGYVPQDYGLFPHLSVRRNIVYGIPRSVLEKEKTWVDQLISVLGLQDLQHHLPSGISGGQRQRVALARALARRPKLLLLDEPLSALDAPTRASLRLELRRTLRELAVPAVLVTHDWEDTLTLGDQMILLVNGDLLQSGTPLDILTRPESLAVASVVGVETVTPGRRVRRERGIAELDVAGLILWAADVDFQDDDVYVCIRAENVTLEVGSGTRSSARNHLPGTVTSLAAAGPLVRVTVDVGFKIQALVSRQALEDLDLDLGSDVIAGIKATAVHLVPR
jgi:molybdate transport system ATP-binding protein